jgi:acyl carrier protein
MSNKAKLFESFASALNIPVESVNEELAYQGIPEWDSISHMVLISQLEEDFGVSIATDDVIDMSSVAKAMEILGKQGVSF